MRKKTEKLMVIVFCQVLVRERKKFKKQVKEKKTSKERFLLKADQRS